MTGTQVRIFATRLTLGLAVFAATALAQTFSSSDGPVSVGPTAGGVTPASPYPSQITVPNSVTGTVTSVQITLHGLNADGNSGSSTTFLGIVLISPDGRQFELLNGPSDASETLTNLTLNIADGNPNAMPDQSSAWPVLTGSYSVRPSSYGNAFSYPSPGPGFPAHTAAPDGTGTFGNVFTGAAAAGTWKLFMADQGVGDSVNFSSWDLILTVSATATSTSTTLSSSLNPSFTAAPNNAVTLTATVSSGSGAPTGTVVFKDGVATISGCGSSALSASGPNSSTATCLTSFATEGNHPLVASYSGGGSFLASTSSTVNQFVKHHSTLVGGQYCNTASVSAPGQANTSPYPSVVNVGTDTTAIGNSVQTLTLTLKGLSGQTGLGALKALLVSPGGANSLVFLSDAGFSVNQPTVDVTFSDNGAGQVAQNSVLTSTSYQPTSYDSPTIPSPPAPAPQVPAMVSVAAPGGGGGSRTLTTAFNGAAPNGDWSLFLYDNGGTQSNVTVANGWCLNITPATGTPTTTTLASSLNPSRSGIPVTITATVKNANTLAPVTIGNVTFTEHGLPVAGGPASPVAVDVTGHAAFTTSSLAEGDHVIVATYNDPSSTFNLSFASILQRNDNNPNITVNGNVTTVCNPGAIAIPANSNSPLDIGAGNPNPSNIFVSGLVGTLSSMSVTLNGFHHPGPSAVTSLLVGPQDTNAATLDFFSGAGGLSPLGPVNLTFSDSGATLVPQNSAPASGTFKPTSYSSNDTYTASPSGFFTLPGGPYQYAAPSGAATLGSVFGTPSPNGTWSLYFNQTLHASGGGVNSGWCLNFTLITPVLSITKTHAGNFTQGQTGATYTITVTNNGPGSTAGTVTVTDTVPSGLTATSISGTNWTCTQPAGPCTRGDALPQGNSYDPITLTVNVANNAPASVTNTATVSGGGDGTHSANDATTISQAPDLTIAKTHSGNFRQGDVGDTYSITVTNSGAGPTSGTVTVADTLPSGLTATAIAGAGWTCTQPSGPCSRNDALAPSASYPAITLTVNVANNAPASVTNSATVSGGGEFNTGNDTASDPTTVVQVADLTIAKSHSGNFRQGDSGDTYTITVSNAGPGPTTGTVSVTDTVPSGLTATAIAGIGWTCTQPAGPCSRSDVLAASASYPVITLTVNVANNAPASVTNTATVSGGGELNTGNDTASDPTTVVQAADLTIAKSHSGNFRQGDSGDTYTITVSNAGPGPTVGTVSVSDTVPSGLTATSIAGAGWTCTQPAGPCSRSDVLAASASYPAITLTVNVDNNAPSLVTNSATVSGGGELNTANDTATDPTTVTQAADLTIAKSHSGNFRQGDSGDTYTITVSNAGPGPTVGTVSVTDTVPSGLTATAIAGTGWTCTQPAGPCSRSDVLAASASYPAITLTVNVANNAPSTVTNSATVSGGGELNTANDSASDPTTVIQVADLTIAKSHSGNFRQGDSGDTYTITVSNAGPGPTVGTVSVTDTVPSGLTATAIAGSGWTCTQPSGPCSRSDVLAASASYPAITLTVNVANNAPASVTNSATVSGGGELNTGNDSASDPTTVTQVADLTITKTHSGNFVVGDTGRTYTITVSNAGPGPTVGTVTVSDTVPSGLTATSIAGTGWTCTQPSGPCSRSDVLAANASYPAITLTVNVANNAPASVTNVATVSGGGELNTGNDTASDVTSIVIPTTTMVSPASGQYSDTTTLTATVSPTSFNSQVLSGTVMFTVNGNAAGSAPVNGAGVATVPYSIQLAAGPYSIVAQFVSSNPAFGNSAGSNTLTVTRENATVTPSSSNPFSVQVNSPGGTAGPITLAAAITETPDGSPGDISNAVPVTCTLTPIVSAPTLTQTASVTGGGVGGTLNASCTFNNVPVNVYDVTFTVGGNFYTGVSPVTILAVFDITAGSATGGGTITHNGVKANFGFNAKYLNNGSPQGSLDYVEHRSTGDVHVKGTTVQSLSIVGNTAIFIIQVTLNGVSGYTAQVTVTDNGEPGAGHDTFGLQVTAPDNSAVSDLTFSPITIDAGNIQVK